MSRKGGEICQVDLFIKPSPARCTLECSSPQCMPKHDRPPSQVLSTVCFSFQLLVVWRISRYLLFVRGWWQSHKVPFGKWSDTCWEMPTWSSRFFLQQCSLARFLPHLRPCALASVVIKKAGRKSVNLALAKYTDLKGIYLGKGKCWDYLGKNWSTHMLCFCRTWSKGLMTSAGSDHRDRK